MPVSQTLFPFNTYVVKIDPILKDYITKKKIEYVGAFTMQDPLNIQTTYISERTKKEEEQAPEKELDIIKQLKMQKYREDNQIEDSVPDAQDHSQNLSELSQSWEMAEQSTITNPDGFQLDEEQYKSYELSKELDQIQQSSDQNMDEMNSAQFSQIQEESKATNLSEEDEQDDVVNQKDERIYEDLQKLSANKKLNMKDKKIQKFIRQQFIDNNQFNVIYDDNTKDEILQQKTVAQIGESLYFSLNTEAQQKLKELSFEYEKQKFFNPGVIQFSFRDLYHVGVLCQISIQEVQTQFNEKYYLAVLKSLMRIEIQSNSIEMSDEISEKKQFFSFLDKFSHKLEKDLEQHHPSQPIKQNISEEKPVLENYLYQTKLIPTELYQQKSIIEQQQQFQFKQLYKELHYLYQNLKSQLLINMPELIESENQYFKNVDIICGFLCLTSLFDNEKIQPLLETTDLMSRARQCIDLLNEYKNVSFSELSQIKQTINKKINDKPLYENIYNFLKKIQERNCQLPSLEKIQNRIKRKQFPKKIHQLIQEELTKLKEMNEMHYDFNVQQNYLELLSDLPFGVFSQDNLDIKHANKILEQDHYGLEDIKQRILEIIAVSNLKKSITGRVILLVGSPGVGKTSIASSIAKCLNRKFVRISLGGESDISIIKGHRKTYLGSYPGKIIQALRTAQTQNPVILLDEIDKLQKSSFKGNIQDALLEVLDSSYNKYFTDNFLDLPFDLSQILFICTANSLDSIHPSLLDRGLY